jgi:hypothetical protein
MYGSSLYSISGIFASAFLLTMADCHTNQFFKMGWQQPIGRNTETVHFWPCLPV